MCCSWVWWLSPRGPWKSSGRGFRQLQEIIRITPQVRAGERNSQLIRLPTGDGMALLFFGDPIVCVECALEITAQLKKTGLKLRMGINTGPVYRVADINANLNAAGGGIDMAQRIMDAGDAGHILVSQSTAEVLLQLKDWAPRLHDLGTHRVKHGVALQFLQSVHIRSGKSGTPVALSGRAHKLREARQKARPGSCGGRPAGCGSWPHGGQPDAGGKRRRSVAVMGFRNITARPEAAWVSTDLAEGLRAQLGSTGKLRTISGEESLEMSKDLGIREFGSMGKNTLNGIHSRGADIVIVGSYTDLADKRIHLNVEIQDTEAGETIDSLVAEGTEGEISQLIMETGQRLRTKMGLGQI